MAHPRGPWSAAGCLGRGRPLTAPVAAGRLVRLLTERFPSTAASLWTDEDTVEIQVPGSEIIFIYLWAIAVRALSVNGLVLMAVFLVVLMYGEFYAWKKGDLKWR